MKPRLPEEVLNWLYFADEDYASAEIMMRESVYNRGSDFSLDILDYPGFL